MKLYFMKEEALDIIKSNLDTLYNKYFIEKDNKWLYQVCGGDPFCEFKEIPDFELESLDRQLKKGEIDFNNCKILYENLKFLTESQACDERLWAGLCHTVFYNYTRKRYGYDKVHPKNAKNAASEIKSRFFYSGGTRAGLYRNTLAKCWWVGRNTYDPENKNHFEKLDIIGSNDLSTKISDIFYSNNYSSNPVILNGIIKGIKYFNDKGIKLLMKEHIRPTLKLLNAIGGAVILDCIEEEKISAIFIDNICDIMDGTEQGLLIRDNDCELDELERSEISETEEEVYVSVGGKINVYNETQNENKTIVVDYIPNTSTIPELARCFLGKRVNSVIEFNGDRYKILEIK